MADLDMRVLETLHDYFRQHPGDHKMTWNKLLRICEAELHDVVECVHGLREKGWAEFDLTKGAEAGLVWLTQTGIRVAKDGLEKIGSKPCAVRGSQVGVTEFARYFKGISYEDFMRMSGESGVTESALNNFFKILETEPIPLSDDLDHTFRKNAELLTLLMLVQWQAAEHDREPAEREKASSHAGEIKSEIFRGWKTVFTAVVSIASYKIGEQVLTPLRDMIRSESRPAFAGVRTLRSYPAILSERNVRDMIRKYNFYCKKYDWTKNFYNESSSFRNDFVDNREALTMQRG